MGPLLYLVYVNKLSAVIEDEHCSSQTHLSTLRLFGDRCRECGDLTAYADDAQYLTVSNSRMRNQIQIEETFDRLIAFFNANGLEVNQAKTTLTEYMSKQKRARLRGIPPELTVDERKGDIIQEKLITDDRMNGMLGLTLQNNLSWEGHLVGGEKSTTASNQEADWNANQTI